MISDKLYFYVTQKWFMSVVSCYFYGNILFRNVLLKILGR